MKGKGVYIWKPYNIGTPAEVTEALVASGTDFVAIKIHDAGYVYPNLEPYIHDFRAAGIKVGSWGYVYLKWNVLAELKGANAAISRYKPDWYLIDAEAQAKSQFAAALIFARGLRASNPKLPIGLNSYWKPSYHPLLPWYQFQQVCNFDAPQVYWRGYNVLGKLADSKREYSKLIPKLPFTMPAGDMYTDRNLKPTPAQVVQFLTACRDDPEINAAVMWSMDQKTKVPELWDAYSRFDWQTGDVGEPGDIPPAEPLPLYTAVVTARRGLNVRFVPQYWQYSLRALRLGDRVDVYGVENGWAYIEPDRSEWVYAYYLKKV